jgi:AAA domain
MNQIQTFTLPPVLSAENQQHTKNTSTPLLPPPELVDQPQPTLATFTELLAAYQTSVATPPVPFIPNKTEPSSPFPFSPKNLATATTLTPQPVSWLWQQRLPLAGITLLDGDHGLGKTLLAHQIAAAVSSGSPMPDGTPTIQGGVIIVTPFTDPSTTQLQLLTALGADLSRIEILSFVPNQDPPPPQAHQFPPSDSRPFSLPKDLTHLFAAVERIDARLILFDPFIYLLSSQHRYTNHHLCHLLTDLNQFLLTHNIACLLVRNCRAKGGHAKPSTLEQSDHFPTIAVSRLLLAPDPMQSDHILLSHALSRHSPLPPTLACQIQPLPTNPNLAHFTLQGTHTLQASHLLTQRPDTLHRLLLAQQLLPILTNSHSPVPTTALYALFPNSSIFQIQRALKDLLLRDHIQRPTRGFYTAYPTTPNLNSTAATTSSAPLKLNPTAATTSQPTLELNHTAATTSLPTTKLNHTAATTPLPTTKLNTTAATTPQPTPKLNTTAATTSLPATNLNHTAATTPQVTTQLDPTPPTTPNFNHTAATTPQPTPKLNTTAATTLLPTPKLNTTAATITKPKASRPYKHPSKQNKSHGRPGQSKKRP